MAAKKGPGRAAAGPAESGESAPSFEDALERLETIVEELESGSLTLEESIARYEEGMKLSKRLTSTLDEAEKRIERLIDSGGEAAPATEPMELEENASEGPSGSAAAPQPPARTSTRAPSRSAALPDPDELPF
jgi:exodeoxyribonuclease VII small subunit